MDGNSHPQLAFMRVGGGRLCGGTLIDKVHRRYNEECGQGLPGLPEHWL
jgi:hypothetical protein